MVIQRCTEVENDNKKGMFPFDKLIRFYPFEQINEAFEASHSGECIKAVLKMSYAYPDDRQQLVIS